MVKIPDKVKGIIDKYLVALKNNNIPVKQAILFGSYAKGNYDEWSDIDLALVSEVFEGIRIIPRIAYNKNGLSVRDYASPDGSKGTFSEETQPQRTSRNIFETVCHHYFLFLILT